MQQFTFSKVFTRKLEEVGRVLFLISLTQKIPSAHKQSHVSMLQEDLLRLPSFPRSAIDAEFSLFNDPQGMFTAFHIRFTAVPLSTSIVKPKNMEISIKGHL